MARRRSSVPLTTPSWPGDGPVYRRLAKFAAFWLKLISKEVWDDADQLPATGGVLVVSNHITWLDVPAVGRYLIWSGRWPRYLGKIELWRVPVIGWLARKCGQIPVLRGTSQAADSLTPAREALRGGQCVSIFPEGIRTKDPDLWPMAPRTGAARLALSTGVPVIPVVHWGTHKILPKSGPKIPRIFARHPITIVMGDPIDLSDLVERGEDREAVLEASARIMDRLREMVAQLRGEPVPLGDHSG